MVPVSLRQPGDVDSGNAVAMICADLATNIADPAKRIQAIMASVKAGKAFFDGMSPKEIERVSMLMQTPSALMMPLGLMSRLPAYNIAISNVPGIREPMYWNGARMNGTYPLSIVMDGMAINITLVTYDQNVDFGIIACRRSVPQVQRLIDYMEDALAELEEAAGLSSSPTPKRKTTAKPRSSAKAAVKKKAKTGPKPKTAPKAKAETNNLRG
jgi:WS/DGAT/MGAT family acyltransferase